MGVRGLGVVFGYLGWIGIYKCGCVRGRGCACGVSWVQSEALISRGSGRPRLPCFLRHTSFCDFLNSAVHSPLRPARFRKLPLHCYPPDAACISRLSLDPLTSASRQCLSEAAAPPSSRVQRQSRISTEKPTAADTACRIEAPSNIFAANALSAQTPAGVLGLPRSGRQAGSRDCSTHQTG